MGAWGTQPFDSDQALDAAYDMTTPEGVIRQLQEAERYQDGLVALAIAYVMALALTDPDERETILAATQSEGTTLMPTIYGVDVPPFVPEEIAEALRSVDMPFSAEHCARALMLVQEACATEEALDDWKSRDKREATVKAVMEHLERVMPDASSVPAPADDDECL